MKRIILTLAAAAALILVPVGTASATSSSATKVVSWKLADGSTFANRWAGGDQTLVVAPATCGKIQVDTYKYDTPEHVKTVDGLIAGGKLGLVNGHPADSSVYISNTDTDLGDCPPPPTTLTVLPGVSFTDKCELKNDSITYKKVDHVTYKLSPKPGLVGRRAVPVTVTAIADAGFVFPAGTTTAWSHTFTDKACPTTVVHHPKGHHPVTPAKPSLAYTGVTDWLIYPAGGLFLLAGGAFYLKRRWARV
jgi:LPXTG-motif cell wall-anchored protein